MADLEKRTIQERLIIAKTLIDGVLAHWSVLRTVVVLPKDGCIKAFADSFGKENR